MAHYSSSLLSLSDLQTIIAEDGFGNAIANIDAALIRDLTLRCLIEEAQAALEEITIYMENPEEEVLDSVDDYDDDEELE